MGDGNMKERREEGREEDSRGAVLGTDYSVLGTRLGIHLLSLPFAFIFLSPIFLSLPFLPSSSRKR
jgi:hypothetical protein